MGTNHFGEISRLSEIACPDIAVITCVGEAHIEFFGSRHGVLRAKLEIMDGLKPDGVMVLNGDDELLWDLKGKLPFKTMYFGIEKTLILIAEAIPVFVSAPKPIYKLIIFIIR